MKRTVEVDEDGTVFYRGRRTTPGDGVWSIWYPVLQGYRVFGLLSGALDAIDKLEDGE